MHIFRLKAKNASDKIKAILRAKKTPKKTGIFSRILRGFKNPKKAGKVPCPLKPVCQARDVSTTVLVFWVFWPKVPKNGNGKLQHFLGQKVIMHIEKTRKTRFFSKMRKSRKKTFKRTLFFFDRSLILSFSVTDRNPVTFRHYFLYGFYLEMTKVSIVAHCEGRKK